MTRNELRTQISTATGSIIESEFVSAVSVHETSGAITVTVHCPDQSSLDICDMTGVFGELPTTDFTHTEIEGFSFVRTYLD